MCVSTPAAPGGITRHISGQRLSLILKIHSEEQTRDSVKRELDRKDGAGEVRMEQQKGIKERPRKAKEQESDGRAEAASI